MEDLDRQAHRLLVQLHVLSGRTRQQIRPRGHRELKLGECRCSIAASTVTKMSGHARRPTRVANLEWKDDFLVISTVPKIRHSTHRRHKLGWLAPWPVEPLPHRPPGRTIEGGSWMAPAGWLSALRLPALSSPSTSPRRRRCSPVSGGRRAQRRLCPTPSAPPLLLCLTSCRCGNAPRRALGDVKKFQSEHSIAYR